MGPLGRLSGFQLHRPLRSYAQDELLQWLAQAYARAELAQRNPSSQSAHRKDTEAELTAKFRRAIDRFGCDSTQISRRGVVVPDPASTHFEKMEIYRILPKTQGVSDSGPYVDGPVGTGMLARTRFFSRAALEALEQLYPTGVPAPSHLVHVTCTGYSSPSAAQRLVDARQWQGVTDVTHAYHMGCYASLPAIRLACGLASQSGRPVDLAHTEICSLHLNPMDSSPEQMVVNSLFGDGFVKYTAEPPAQSSQRTSVDGMGALEILAIRELLVPGTAQDMTWNTADWGMSMSLSRKVPALLAGQLADFVSAMRNGLPEGSPVFAIHPGGPKIVDAVRERLGLSEDQIRHSRKVLHDYGNMSSATLPHIWKEMLEDPALPSGQTIISLAFGPGLTIFGGILRKCA